jgi:putative ABC transport system substrate-binding protein
MRRRKFSTLFGGIAAASCSPLVRAQQSGLPVIGFLSSVPAAAVRRQVAAFHRGLGETGHVVGRTVAIEYRWADNNYDRLPALAGELVRFPVAVIVAAGGNITAGAAKAATPTIPIVFTAVSDPVKGGLVASFNRPGGNVTGVAILSAELDTKRLELLHELVPSSGAIGVLVNPGNPNVEVQRRALEATAKAVGRHAVVVQVGKAEELDAAFATLAEQRATALVVGADSLFASQRERLVALAARHSLPAIYQWREFAEAGGLVSYGPDFSEAYRQAGIYTGRILNGGVPADLPVLQPTKFELVINAGTAKTLGLTIPQVFFTRADEIIE